MGFIDILPSSIRIALLYVGSSKIAKKDGKSNKEKLQLILKKEKFWQGTKGFVPTGKGEVNSPALCIGMRDMAGIFVKLHSPDDALRYLNGIGGKLMTNLNNLPNDKQHAHKRQSIYEAQIFAWLHEATAYAQKNDVNRVKGAFDKMNQNLLSAIESDPSNKRLHDIYLYMIESTFNTFIDMAKEYSANKQNIYRTCLDLLMTYNQRDPGNDMINEFIGRFH